MIRTIFCLAISIFFLSCHHKELIGAYYYKSEFVNHKLDLKPDSTFSYEVIGDVGKPNITMGKWSFDSESLHLRSYDSFKKITVIEGDSIGLKIPIILIEGLVKEDFINEYITFDNDTAKYYFEHNSITVPSSLIKFQKICLHAYEVDECKTRSASGKNLFRVIYNNRNNGPSWFIDDNWKFRDGKLYIDSSFFLSKKN